MTVARADAFAAPGNPTDQLIRAHHQHPADVVRPTFSGGAFNSAGFDFRFGGLRYFTGLRVDVKFHATARHAVVITRLFGVRLVLILQGRRRPSAFQQTVRAGRIPVALRVIRSSSRAERLRIHDSSMRFDYGRAIGYPLVVLPGAAVEASLRVLDEPRPDDRRRRTKPPPVSRPAALTTIERCQPFGCWVLRVLPRRYLAASFILITASTDFITVLVLVTPPA